MNMGKAVGTQDTCIMAMFFFFDMWSNRQVAELSVTLDSATAPSVYIYVKNNECTSRHLTTRQQPIPIRNGIPRKLWMGNGLAYQICLCK